MNNLCIVRTTRSGIETARRERREEEAEEDRREREAMRGRGGRGGRGGGRGGRGRGARGGGFDRRGGGREREVGRDWEERRYDRRGRDGPDSRGSRYQKDERLGREDGHNGRRDYDRRDEGSRYDYSLLCFPLDI